MHLNPWFIIFLVLYFGTYATYVITRTVIHGWPAEARKDIAAGLIIGFLLWFFVLPYTLSKMVIRAFAKDPIKEIIVTPDEQGYWLITRTDRALPFGNAYEYNIKDVTHGKVPTPSQRMLSFTRQGLVFGPAGFISHGDVSGTVLDAPIVTALLTKSGQGYWMVGADGTVHAFGEAGFFGDTSKAPDNYGISWRADMADYAHDGAQESMPFLFQHQLTTTSAPTPMAGTSTASAS